MVGLVEAESAPGAATSGHASPSWWKRGDVEVDSGCRRWAIVMEGPDRAERDER